MNGMNDILDAVREGTISEEDYNKLLNGEGLPEDDGKTVSTTESEEQPAPATEEGKEDKKEQPETKAETAAESSDAVIMAKDGKHVINFDDYRNLKDKVFGLVEQNTALLEKLTSHESLLAKLQEAEKSDEKTGTTEAVDELVEDLSVEFPGAAKLITSLQGQLAEISKREAAKQEEIKLSTEQANAKAALDSAVSEIEPRYQETVTNPKFWEWFNGQSALIQSSKTSGNPQIIADVVSLYHAEKASGGNTPPVKETVDIKSAAEKVSNALKKAESKSAIHSLSDIPGGSHIANTEDERVKGMSVPELSAYLSTKTPDEIDKIIAKIL